MKMTINCDTYLYNLIELAEELDVVCNKVNKKYSNIEKPIEIGFAFRCLPDEIGRKSFRRYDKDHILTLDITVSYEKYLKLYKTERRHDLGHTFYDFLSEALKKYKFNDLNTQSLLEDIKKWCNEIGWLLDEVDYSVDLE